MEEVSITITTNPSKPFFNTPTGTTTVSCNGNDGAIDLTVTGATPPYSFKWYNANNPSTVISTSEDPSGLAPGDYFVIIEDQIPCNMTSANFTIAAKVPTNISYSTIDVDCIGNSTGSINATVSGQSPFTYSWSTGSSLEDINGLSVGTYTLTVTDADGCQQSASVTITQPDQLVPTIIATTDETDSSLDNGTIDLEVSGGTPSYTYDWDNNGSQDPDSDSQDPTGLAAGIYTVTITDANGCTTTISATIYEPEICDDGIDNDGDGLTDCQDNDCLPPDPGPITASNNPVCVGDQGVTYSIADVGATTYQWTVPTGATIVSGQGTTSITVNWVSNQGNQICVSAISDAGCQSSVDSCLSVEVNTVPPQPGTIIIQN